MAGREAAARAALWRDGVTDAVSDLGTYWRSALADAASQSFVPLISRRKLCTDANARKSLVLPPVQEPI